MFSLRIKFVVVSKILNIYMKSYEKRFNSHSELIDYCNSMYRNVDCEVRANKYDPHCIMVVLN